MSSLAITIAVPTARINLFPPHNPQARRRFNSALALLRAERAVDHPWNAPASFRLDRTITGFEAVSGVS